MKLCFHHASFQIIHDILGDANDGEINKLKFWVMMVMLLFDNFF